jgi:N-acetylglucosaminyl-diphospho-decaprenol L-rhamnosyltransferase
VTTTSIITVAHASHEVLPRFAAAATSAAPNAELLVVDNGPTGHAAAALGEFPQARIIATRRNVGFGRACNYGASAASGDTLVFANPDVWLSACAIETVAEVSPVGMFAGMIASPAHPRVGRSALRREPSRAGEWYNDVVARILPRELPRRPAHAGTPGYACGALCLVNAQEFRDIGGFDDRFFLYHEDRDLGRRYRQAGLPLSALPGLSGIHLHGASSSTMTSISGQAWSLVSWIEYTGIWSGQAAADTLTVRLMAALDAIVRALRVVRRVGSGRAVLKAAEIRGIRDHIARFQEHLPTDVDGFYPHASNAVAAWHQAACSRCR